MIDQVRYNKYTCWTLNLCHNNNTSNHNNRCIFDSLRTILAMWIQINKTNVIRFYYSIELCQTHENTIFFCQDISVADL
jgi:hypothetical protein